MIDLIYWLNCSHFPAWYHKHNDLINSKSYAKNVKEKLKAKSGNVRGNFNKQQRKMYSISRVLFCMWKKKMVESEKKLLFYSFFKTSIIILQHRWGVSSSTRYFLLLPHHQTITFVYFFFVIIPLHRISAWTCFKENKAKSNNTQQKCDEK